MSYTVLARKYRSQTFDEVVGQEAVARTLKSAIEQDRVAHAYLFCGTRGVGKTTLARILAKSLNCLESDKPTVEPCCRCDSCVAINQGEDLDVLEIDGASNNGVEQVRQLRENASYRPVRGRFKVYIIDEVHMLSVSAFNALLKILEEPPGHVKFIFATTEPNKVLATIQSRCQRFDLRNISLPDIAAQLRRILQTEDIEAEEDLVLTVAKMANGSMRDGLSLLDRLISTGQQPLSVALLEEYLGVPPRDRIFALAGHIGDGDAKSTLTQLDALLVAGLSESQIVDALIEVLRDLMVLQTAGPDTPLVILTESQRTLAESIRGRFDAAALIYAVTALERLRWHIRNSDSPRALLEAACLRLALDEHFIGVEHLRRAAAARPEQHQKKNATALTVTTASKSSAPAAPQSSQPARTAPETPRTDLAGLQRDWAAVLQRLESTLSTPTVHLLMKARPTSLSQGTLTLEFAADAAFQCQLCQSNGRAEQIQQALAGVVGGPLRVAFTLAENDGSATSPTAKAPSRTRSEVMSDPAVRAVLLGLNATITSIEEKPPQPNGLADPPTEPDSEEDDDDGR